MGRDVEIERKFLVQRIPPKLRRSPSSEILQGYLPCETAEIRLRCEGGSKHYMTVKRGQGLKRAEKEIKISTAQFESLWPLTAKARLRKRRYQVQFAKGIIQIDIYHGAHRGLVTAEIEFASTQQSRSFEPPAWFGREITGQSRYANAALARKKSGK